MILRGFIFSCRVLGSMVVVSWLCCGACTVSYPQPPWPTSGPTRVMPPSRQDDGNIRAPALACVFAVCVWRFARGHVCRWWVCGLMLSDFRRSWKLPDIETGSRHGFPLYLLHAIYFSQFSLGVAIMNRLQRARQGRLGTEFLLQGQAQAQPCLPSSSIIFLLPSLFFLTNSSPPSLLPFASSIPCTLALFAAFVSSSTVSACMLSLLSSGIPWSGGSQGLQPFFSRRQQIRDEQRLLLGRLRSACISLRRVWNVGHRSQRGRHWQSGDFWMSSMRADAQRWRRRDQHGSGWMLGTLPVTNNRVI